MGGLNKPLAKGFQSFRKYSLAQQSEQATIGDKAYDKLHFISTGVIKSADAQAAAEKKAKNANDLAAQLAQQQANDLADLNNQENLRIKKLLLNRGGARSYRGSPLFRAAPSDTAGSGAGRAASAVAAGGASTATASAALRSAGIRGGTANSTFRAARQ